MQFSTRIFALAVLVASTGCNDTAVITQQNQADSMRSCADANGADSRLRLVTKLGVIEIDLYEEAAPASTRAIRNLVCYGAIEPAADAQIAESGYYDGKLLDYTHPNIEVRVAIEQDDQARIPKEINADSLGLHEQIVHTQGQAMDMYQFVVFKEFARNKRSSTHSAQLRAWIEEFDETGDPKFLIGKSHKEIDIALGYAFTDKVESMPIERGSVLLEAASKTQSSARLVLALDALPTRLGKWTVIGKITDGLDIVDRISKAPGTGFAKPRWRPFEPVAIEHADFVTARSDP